MSGAIDLEHLRVHVPPGAWPVVLHWLQQNPTLVKVSRPRITKLGDYRPATKTQPHRITVNSDLNRYSFLVTLVHEFAHYTTVVNTGRWRDPHGPDWKREYQRLMRPFLSPAVFPDDVLGALERHMLRPPASSCTDRHLLRVLRRHDADPIPFLEDLQQHTIFRLNRKLYVKGQRLRRRYKCRCLNDRRMYYIDAMAQVEVGAHTDVRIAS
jgi:hypothetical protein